MIKNIHEMDRVVSRIGITPVGGPKYRVYRLRFHLLAYSIVRKAKLLGKESKFIIRCDDTNSNNVNRDFLDPYLSVLYSLGINPDLTPYDNDEAGFSLFQSKRGELYRSYVDRLIETGLAFKDSSGAIFFSPEKFTNKFKDILDYGGLSVFDASMGNIAVNVQSSLNNKKEDLGFIPFALMRANGEYLFNLCSPVDDSVLGVTYVVRDRGKLNVLARQEMVRVALGLPPVIYVHTPFLVNDNGQKIIYDDYWGDATFQDFIARGILPEGLVSYLLSGLYGPSESYYSTIDNFASRMNLSQIHQSSTVFTESVLRYHNKKAIEASSEDGYRIGIRNYLSFHNPSLLDDFDSDSYLHEMILRMKREFSESAIIIGYILNPTYDIADIDSPHALSLVVNFLIKEVLNKRHSYVSAICDSSVVNAKYLGMSNKNYFKSIRYVLTGKLHGCDLREIVDYFEKSKKMRNRLFLVRNKLSKFNILNKDNNL